MRPVSRESWMDSSTCSFFRESSTSTSSSPRGGVVRLIPIKSGKLSPEKEKVKHHARRKKELHQRLQWIESIFSDSHDIGPHARSDTCPRIQTAVDGLPQWVLLSCPRGRDVHLRSTPKPRKHSCLQRSLSNCHLPASVKQHTISRPLSQQSKRPSTHPVDAMSETSPQSKRSSLSQVSIRLRADSTDQWCHHVLREGGSPQLRHGPSKIFPPGTHSPGAHSPGAHSPGDDQDEVCTAEATQPNNYSGKAFWIMLFGARRLAVKQETKVKTAMSGALASDSLNFLTETEVIELLRRASQKEMDVLKDVPVLVDVWRHGGYPYGVHSEWLTELADQENSRAFLDADEFVSVWTGYFDKLTDLHNDAFTRAAMDSSVVAESCLPSIFREVFFWPMPGALSESVRRIVPSRRRSKGITLADFHKVYNDLYARAGLTTSEHHRAEQLFKQHHADRSHLDVEELYRLLKKVRSNFMLASYEPCILTEGFLYFLAKEVVIRVRERTLSLDMDSWQHVFERASTRAAYHDGVMGTVDINDFFVAVNVLNHHIADRVAKAAERIGLEVTDKMNEKDILNLFDELGHCSPCLTTFLEETFEDCDLLERDEFTFSEFYTVLLTYWNMDSFFRAQKEELSWLFDIFMTSLPDVEKKDGMLRVCELKRALRWMCFTPSQHRLTTFMDLCGMSMGEYMDLNEFSSTVSEYRHSNIGMARGAFRDFEEDEDGEQSSTWTDVPISELHPLLRLVGHTLSDDELVYLTESAKTLNDQISWREFLRLEELYRKTIKENLKNNLGFTAVEVASLHSAFQENIVRGTDFINYQGFSKIFPKFIPRMPIDATVRKVIAESDHNSNHEIEFREFLWIMRRLYDKDSKEEQTRDQKAMDELGYSAINVRELRDLFNNSDKDLSGSLDISEVMKLFMGLVDMSHEAEHELQNYVDQVDNDVNGTLDFWEFLGLMKTLENNNWRNILGAAAVQVRQLDELRQQEAALGAGTQCSTLKARGLSHHMML